MADKDKLRNMLDNIIDAKPEQAQIDFHDYLQHKMKEVIGVDTSFKPGMDPVVDPAAEPDSK